MDKLYDCEFIANRYGVEVRTVWEWIRMKKLPAIKTGKHYRISETDIKTFEESRKVSR